MRTITIALLLCCSWALQAQLTIPPSSAPAELHTQIGLTDFTITYHRPSVKGRVIFGELLPYKQVWRTGANEATLIRFDKDIRIGGDPLAAGTYAIYTIPQEEDNWTFILHTDTTLWGASGYDESKDAARFMLPVKSLAERVETMEFRWMDITQTSAKLCLEWANIRLAIPIEVNTNEQVQASIAQELTASNTNGNDYYRAARYYLDNNLDLQQAKGWMDKRIELGGEQFGVMRYQAFIERKLGNFEEANRIMQRSLELAESRPNPHYVRINTQTLREWNKEAVAGMDGASLLAKSINYHDPNGVWETEGIDIKLYESRPGGGYRLTDLAFNSNQETFLLDQRRGRDHIVRELRPDGCAFKLNGQEADFSEEEIRRFRLSCEGNELYKNYYSYLWGLPMKLTDPGTIVDPKVHNVDFFGDELLEVKVTYSEEVGADIWYFYFDPITYALSGYRFYHDEADNDGEYILVEGEAQVGQLRLPAQRHWYTHGDRRYLGSDEIVGER
ncbi:MAG: DUF6503 family protein [Bacteroidota bacterium]